MKLKDLSKEGFNLLTGYKVDENLFAGEKPYSLFNQNEIITELTNIGVTAIINLMEESEIKYDITAFKEKFEYFIFPIVDNTVPDTATIDKILALIENRGKIYLHCNLGLGRTGVLVACCLIKKMKISGAQALDEIRKLKSESKLANFSSPITKEQIKFVKNYEYV